MLWQKKKKRKKATKPKAVTQTAAPLTGNDNKENYWFTPMYFSNVWVLRRIFGGR